MSRARRAKQSKKSKKMLLTLALITGVTGTLAVYSTKISDKSIGTLASKVNTYETNEFVQDIFTVEDGTRYLPIVYGDAYDKITKEEIQSRFRNAGIEIESISSENIGTGTKINTKNATYTVLIYGDIDGNGTVDIRDVNKIIRSLLYDEVSTITGINAMAANVQDVSEKAIDIRDVHRIVEFLLERNTIIDLKDIPESDIKRDNEKPTIEILGDNPLLIRKNGEYVDPGIKVTDNLDPNVKWTVSPKTIDTSVPGKYNVVYTATDASGNTETAVRVVEVEDELAPVITLSDPREEIVINVFDKDAFDALDLTATATDGKEENIKVEIEGIDKVDIEVPGEYKIIYTATNSQGNSAIPVERTIKVLNYVTDISLSGNISKTQYIEDEEIDLEGVEVTITRAYGTPVTVSLADLKSNEDIDGEYYEIILDPFETVKAVYDETNDSANANIQLTAKCIFNNPADGNKVESNNRRIGYVTVIGHIREFITVNDSSFVAKTSGEIYEPINVIKVTTKRYQEELTDKNLKVNITSADGDKSSVHKQINYTDTGAEIIIWASEPGTYRVTLEAGQAESISRNITLTESNVVDDIELGKNGELFEGVLKAGGDYKDIPVNFIHNYGTSQTEIVPRQIEVTANRITFTKESEIERYSFIGLRNGELVELNNTDSTTPVTGIRIWAKAGVVASGLDKISRTIRVEVDKGTAGATIPETTNVDIYPDSTYRVLMPEQTLKLYLQDDGSDNIFRDTDGTLYTLLPIQKVDQYLDQNDPKYEPAKASDISNLESTINDGKIAFVDSACKYDTEHKGTPFIKVAGFNDRTAGGYTKVSSGNIQYVGIAIRDVLDEETNLSIGDEDIRLEARSEIYVYHGNATTPVITLEIEEIVKKDITELRFENLVTKDYCFETTNIVQVKSGFKQKPLTDGMLSYEAYKNGSSYPDRTVEIREAGVIDGTVNLEFKAPNAGTYKIKATLNKNGKTVTKTTEDITITENPIVTGIAFKTKGSNEEPSNEFGIVKVNKTVRKDIVYMHAYTDKNGNAILDERGRQIVRQIETENIPMFKDITVPEYSNIEINLYYGDHNLNKETNWPEAPIDGISITVKPGAAVDKVPFKMQVDNSKYAGYVTNETRVVDVNSLVEIGPMSPIKGVTLKPLNANNSMNLYKNTMPTSGSKDKVINYTNGATTAKYTLFEIAFIDEDNDEITILDAAKIQLGQGIGSAAPGTILIADDAYDPDFEDGGIEIRKFAKSTEQVNGETVETYTSITSGQFQYLGIRVTDTSVSLITITYADTNFTLEIPVSIDGRTSRQSSKARAIKASVQKTETDNIKTTTNTTSEPTNTTVDNTVDTEDTNNIANTSTNTNNVENNEVVIPETNNNTIEQNKAEPVINTKQEEE